LRNSGDVNTINNATSSQGGSGGSAMNNSGNKTTNIKPSTNINSNNVIKTK